MTPEAARNLPRFAQDFTPEQTEACVAYLATLGLPELRHRQQLWNEQIANADWSRVPDSDAVWTDMDLKGEQIRRAILRVAGLDKEIA